MISPLCWLLSSSRSFSLRDPFSRCHTQTVQQSLNLLVHMHTHGNSFSSWSSLYNLWPIFSHLKWFHTWQRSQCKPCSSCLTLSVQFPHISSELTLPVKPHTLHFLHPYFKKSHINPKISQHTDSPYSVLAPSSAFPPRRST